MRAICCALMYLKPASTIIATMTPMKTSLSLEPMQVLRNGCPRRNPALICRRICGEGFCSMNINKLRRSGVRTGEFEVSSPRAATLNVHMRRRRTIGCACGCCRMSTRPSFWYPFWRPVMVFRLLGVRPSRLGAVEAAGRKPICYLSEILAGYTWLAQCLCRVTSSSGTTLPWHALQRQFGEEYRDTRDFKRVASWTAPPAL